MTIDNQQERLLNMKYSLFMLDSIPNNITIRRDFSEQQTLEFILNINNKDYSYFKQTFGLSRDMTKNAKKIIFDVYEKNIPNGFKQLEDFPDYAVDQNGNVIYIRQRYILKHSKNKHGYMSVCLSNKKTKTVHRLVAKTFINNEFNKPQVNHIDGNKANNCVKNLEWCTRDENMKHAVKNLLTKTNKRHISSTGQNNSQAKLSPKDIFDIRSCKAMTNLELANIYNVSVSNISSIRNRNSWKHI